MDPRGGILAALFLTRKERYCIEILEQGEASRLAAPRSKFLYQSDVYEQIDPPMLDTCGLVCDYGGYSNQPGNSIANAQSVPMPYMQPSPVVLSSPPFSGQPYAMPQSPAVYAPPQATIYTANSMQYTEPMVKTQALLEHPAVFYESEPLSRHLLGQQAPSIDTIASTSIQERATALAASIAVISDRGASEGPSAARMHRLSYVIENPELTTKPSFSAIERMSDAQLAEVLSFYVRNEYGFITWNKTVDLRNKDLNVISISREHFSIGSFGVFNGYRVSLKMSSDVSEEHIERLKRSFAAEGYIVKGPLGGYLMLETR